MEAMGWKPAMERSIYFDDIPKIRDVILACFSLEHYQSETLKFKCSVSVCMERDIVFCKVESMSIALSHY